MREGCRFRAPWRAVLLLLVVLLQPPTGATEAALSARIIGTYHADILACPRPACSVLATIPLDASISVAGASINGFMPVRYKSSAGFVDGTYVYAPSLGSRPPEFSEGAAGCNRVALIFNIGAGFPPATDVLDTLENDQVPATMFVMGWWADHHGDLLKRIVGDGFAIGSHGNLPPELTGRADDDVASDLRTAAQAITRAAGAPPGPWFTPYAAAIDDRVRGIAASEGYLPIAWTVRSEDWRPDATADDVYHRVVTNAGDGSIVELHLDASTSLDSTATALPWIIRDLRAEGFHFVTIPDMLQPCESSAGSPIPVSPAIASPVSR
jgi:peptidoglycan/xylan/chitin deacetylase (PgdA/CDA1 family)